MASKTLDNETGVCDVPDGADAPPTAGVSDARYWLGGASATLTAAHNLGALGNGLVLTTAGVPSIASLVGLTLVAGVLTASPGEILSGTASEIIKAGTVLSLSPVVTGAIATNTSNIATLTTTVGGHTTSIASNASNIDLLDTILAAALGRKFIVQQPSGDLPGAQALSALSTGILKSTTTTGVLSIAAAGADYEVPLAFTGGLTRATNTVSIDTAGVTYAKIQNVAGASVVGRSATSAGVPAAITGSTIGHVLTVQADNSLAFSAPSSFTSPLTTKGDVYTRSSSADARLAVGSNGQVLTADAASTNGVKWATPTAGGYTTIERPNGTPVTARAILSLTTEFTATDNVDTTDIALATAGVGLAKLVDLAGLSVLGRSANSSGVMAAITAVTDGHVLRLSGTTLGFGTLAAGAFADTTIVGARLSGFTNNTLPIGNSSTQLTNSTITLASNVLTHSAASAAGTVSAVVANTDTTAASNATIAVRAATGATGGDASLIFGANNVDWSWNTDRSTSNRAVLKKGATTIAVFNPLGGFGSQIQIFPDNSGTGLGICNWAGSGDVIASAYLYPQSADHIAIGARTSGGAGSSFGIPTFNGTAWKYAFRAFQRSGTLDAAIYPGGGGNLQLFGSNSFGGGVGVLGITNAATAPTSDPSGGHVVYSTAAGVFVRGPLGTISKIADA